MDNLDDLFLEIRSIVFKGVQEKNIDIDALSFDLGISRDTFFDYFKERISNFNFYLDALSYVVNY